MGYTRLSSCFCRRLLYWWDITWMSVPKTIMFCLASMWPRTKGLWAHFAALMSFKRIHQMRAGRWEPLALHNPWACRFYFFLRWTTMTDSTPVQRAWRPCNIITYHQGIRVMGVPSDAPRRYLGYDVQLSVRHTHQEIGAAGKGH